MLCLDAKAGYSLFTDKASFLAITGAFDATGELPNTDFIGSINGPSPGPTTTVGSVTYQAIRYRFTESSIRLPGTELIISRGTDGGSNDSINLTVSNPVFSLGFDFVEPENDPNVNATFIDSTFTVTIKNGTTLLHSFVFNAPNDTAAFIGIWGGSLFDRVEVRETIGGDENEFYGRVYTGTVPVLPGDYNDDGTVDAADYVVWRDNEGAPHGTLPNDINGGTIGPPQYNTWRAHFGEPTGEGTAAANSFTNATVPEPSSLMLLMVMALVVCLPVRIR
jgi:hypothetical protein